MLTLIILIALLGAVVGIIYKIDMPAPFKTAIYVIAAICVVVLVMRGFGIADQPLPQVGG